MRSPIRPLVASLAATLALSAASAASAQVPQRIPIQGTLYTLDGEPIDGTLPVDFTLYADAGRVRALWSDTMTVSFVGGIFTAYIGATDPIDPIIFAQNPQVFVVIADAAASEMDLFAVATAPYAAMAAYAGDADTLDGFTAGDIIDAALEEAEGTVTPRAHGHAWSDLSGIPAGLADGIDNDTQLSEVQVDEYVSNNGFLTAVSWGIIGGIPAGFADGVDNDTQLTEAQVDTMVANNGFLSSVSWGIISGIPAGFADGVDNDTQLTEAQVDTMVANNGYRGAGTRISLVDCNTYPTSGYLNNMDAVLDATCPANQVMRGAYSWHSNSTEDRQWRFYCCALQLQ